MTALRTALTAALGIEHPVLLAPMGSVAGGRLAAAVSDAGGLGLVGVGYAEHSAVAREFDRAGGSPVGCGFITWVLDRRPTLLDLVLDRRPVAVMLSFGDPSPHIPRIHAAGVPVLCQVSSARDAAGALDVGADVVVAQGGEGGGHGTRERSTMTLVPEVCDMVERRGLVTPVVAAGGIADGRGVAAALVLGAAGVLVGTRFWASAEALVSPASHERAAAASGDDTIATTVYDRVRGITWPPGYTSRVLRSPFVADWAGREDELGQELHRLAPAYHRAVRDDDVDVAQIVAGEAVGLVARAEPAGKVLEGLVSGAVAALRDTGGVLD
ncbi:MAG TPA: nitronate monooxygenase [Actinomycetospora sp.]|nr:nitronate monooxygenase [Actinomycetospora sp.]